MTLTWGGLAEAPASIPAGAVTDLSQVEVVDDHRHVLSPPDAGGIALVRDTLTERFAGGLDGEGLVRGVWRVVAGSATGELRRCADAARSPPAGTPTGCGARRTASPTGTSRRSRPPRPPPPAARPPAAVR